MNSQPIACIYKSISSDFYRLEMIFLRTRYPKTYGFTVKGPRRSKNVNNLHQIFELCLADRMTSSCSFPDADAIFRNVAEAS